MENFVRGVDIDQAIRCGYGFVVASQEGMSLDELMTDEFRDSFAEVGNDFEDDIAGSIGLTESEKTVEEQIEDRSPAIYQGLITGTHSLHVLGTDNEIIRLYGRPDILVPYGKDKRVYYPVEIKYHREMAETDILRVEFYAYILRDSYYPRTTRPLREGDIIGYVWLADMLTRLALENGEIDIKKSRRLWHPVRFRGWDELLAQIEKAWSLRNWEKMTAQVKRTLTGLTTNIHIDDSTGDPTPLDLIPRCALCNLGERCEAEFDRRGILSRVRYVGAVRSNLLRKCELNTTRDIYNLVTLDGDDLDTTSLQEWLTERVDNEWRRLLPTNIMTKLALWSIAKEENRCFIIENYTFPSVPYTFYLDTEYDPSENWPFCVGIMVCHGRKKERVQAFFNSQKQFRQWLSMFKDTLGQYSPNAAYSWAGQDQRLLGLKENCIDLYRIVDRCLLIPLKTYELSKLATHLGYKLPRLAIRGGFDCLNAYREYRSTADSGSKILIRKQIQEYNWHDVKMLAHIHREVKRVMST